MAPELLMPAGKNVTKNAMKSMKVPMKAMKQVVKKNTKAMKAMKEKKAMKAMKATKKKPASTIAEIICISDTEQAEKTTSRIPGCSKCRYSKMGCLKCSAEKLNRHKERAARFCQEYTCFCNLLVRMSMNIVVL